MPFAASLYKTTSSKKRTVFYEKVFKTILIFGFN